MTSSSSFAPPSGAAFVGGHVFLSTVLMLLHKSLFLYFEFPYPTTISTAEMITFILLLAFLAGRRGVVGSWWGWIENAVEIHGGNTTFLMGFVHALAIVSSAFSVMNNTLASHCLYESVVFGVMVIAIEFKNGGASAIAAPSTLISVVVLAAAVIGIHRDPYYCSIGAFCGGSFIAASSVLRIHNCFLPPLTSSSSSTPAAPACTSLPVTPLLRSRPPTPRTPINETSYDLSPLGRTDPSEAAHNAWRVWVAIATTAYLSSIIWEPVYFPMLTFALPARVWVVLGVCCVLACTQLLSSCWTHGYLGPFWKLFWPARLAVALLVDRLVLGNPLSLATTMCTLLCAAAFLMLAVTPPAFFSLQNLVTATPSSVGGELPTLPITSQNQVCFRFSGEKPPAVKVRFPMRTWVVVGCIVFDILFLISAIVWDNFSDIRRHYFPQPFGTPELMAPRLDSTLNVMVISFCHGPGLHLATQCAAQEIGVVYAISSPQPCDLFVPQDHHVPTGRTLLTLLPYGELAFEQPETFHRLSRLINQHHIRVVFLVTTCWGDGKSDSGPSQTVLNAVYNSVALSFVRPLSVVFVLPKKDERTTTVQPHEYRIPLNYRTQFLVFSKPSEVNITLVPHTETLALSLSNSGIEDELVLRPTTRQEGSSPGSVSFIPELSPLTEGKPPASPLVRYDGCSDRVAIVLLRTFAPILLPVIQNLMLNLRPDWRFQIFYNTMETYENIIQSRLLRHVQSGKVILSFINSTWNTLEEYNRIRCSLSFWELVRGEHVLIFELDSLLCSASQHRVEQFLEWDFVGAPWPHRIFFLPHHLPPLGGNGGFSLRKRSTTIRCLHKFGWNGEPEDRFFARHLPLVGGRVAPNDVALKFATEGYFYIGAAGVHQPWLSGPGISARRSQFRTEFEKFCPEYKMIARYQSRE